MDHNNQNQAAPEASECSIGKQKSDDALSDCVNKMQISDDPRAKLKSWLCKTLKIIITDERMIVGWFVCTDREGNVILENAWEHTSAIDDEPRPLGLALIPGKHIVSMSLCKDSNKI